MTPEQRKRFDEIDAAFTEYEQIGYGAAAELLDMLRQQQAEIEMKKMGACSTPWLM